MVSGSLLTSSLSSCFCTSFRRPHVPWLKIAIKSNKYIHTYSYNVYCLHNQSQFLLLVWDTIGSTRASSIGSSWYFYHLPHTNQLPLLTVMTTMAHECKILQPWSISSNYSQWKKRGLPWPWPLWPWHNVPYITLADVMIPSRISSHFDPTIPPGYWPHVIDQI